MPKRKQKGWSYKTGEKGRNRVRAFQDPRDGKYWLQWIERVPNGDQEAGREQAQRKRRTILLVGVPTKAEAKIRADQLAARFASMEVERTAPVTLSRLLTLYAKEVTPRKGQGKRDHDRRAIRLWISFFDAQAEFSRRSTRHPNTLDRTDWDRFVQWRKDGRIPGWNRPVGNRQVQYDLKFLIAVLNWGTGHRINGRPVLDLSPWRPELRRAQRWGMPKELNPHRPGMADEIRRGLIQHAANWQFGLALILEREFKRRNNAIRQLLWSDVDLEQKTVLWRAETDKANKAGRAPLSPEAVEAFRSAPSRGIGDSPVFPSASDPGKPTPRNTFQTWLRRAKDRWLESIQEEERADLKEKLRGVGFHAEKRSGVRDKGFRALPPAVQEAISGTSFGTLKNVYDEVTVEDIWEAEAARDASVSRTNRKHELQAE